MAYGSYGTKVTYIRNPNSVQKNFKMKRPQSLLAKNFVKFTTFSILLILFLKFYFVNQVMDFLERITTLTSSFKNEVVSMPDLLLCTTLGVKPSSNFSSALDARNYVSKFNDNSMINRFQEMSYMINKDFEIQYLVNDRSSEKRLLQVGQNLLENESLEIVLIDTLSIGYCLLMKTSTLPKGHGMFIITAKDTLVGQDLESLQFKIILTDENGWQNFVLKQFMYSKPTEIDFHIPDIDSFVYVSLTMSIEKTIFMEGTENRSKCLIEVIAEVREECEPNLCTNIGLMALAPDLPRCMSKEDFEIMDKSTRCGLLGILQFSDCFKPKIITKYHAEPSSFIQKSLEGKKLTIDLSNSGVSNRVDIRKERYIISAEDFIGSIGGSLGLFLGFSFFTLANDMINLSFKKTE